MVAEDQTETQVVPHCHDQHLIPDEVESLLHLLALSLNLANRGALLEQHPLLGLHLLLDVLLLLRIGGDSNAEDPQVVLTEALVVVLGRGVSVFSHRQLNSVYVGTLPVLLDALPVLELRQVVEGLSSDGKALYHLVNGLVAELGDGAFDKGMVVDNGPRPKDLADVSAIEQLIAD